MQEKFIMTSELKKLDKNRGFIYILSNPSQPDCVKIGKTTRLPGCRAAELSSGTAIPEPFNVEYCKLVDNLSEVETTIHKTLEKYRINQGREFFRLTVKDAKMEIDKISSEMIETEYNGRIFRKKQDAVWAMYFSLTGVPFKYCDTPVKLGHGMYFFPDFHLPDQDCYLIISDEFMHNNAGKLMAWCFSRHKGKPVIQLWDCSPGLEFNKDEFGQNHGYYMTPEGDFDGCVEWGLCSECESIHIGHFGTPFLSDNAGTSTSKNNCRCFSVEKDYHPWLRIVYDEVRNYFDLDEKR